MQIIKNPIAILMPTQLLLALCLLMILHKVPPTLHGSLTHVPFSMLPVSLKIYIN